MKGSIGINWHSQKKKSRDCLTAVGYSKNFLANGNYKCKLICLCESRGIQRQFRVRTAHILSSACFLKYLFF